MIEYIHTQLSIWGKWSLANATKGIGYSPVSPMFKGARHGEGYGSNPPPGISIDCADSIRDTDSAVSRLGREQKLLCVEYYVRGGRNEDVAARLGIAKRTLYDRLHAVHQSLLGHLNDVIAGA